MKDTNDTTQDERLITEALEAMKEEAGEGFSLASVNLAELERRTGVTRAKLRRLKENGFDTVDGLHFSTSTYLKVHDFAVNELF